MIRILHSVSNMDRAGIETMLMNYYRHMDKNIIQFDFLCNKMKPGDYDNEILSMGGKIYHSPGLNPLKYMKYISFMRRLFEQNPDYKVIEAHNGAFGVYSLYAAKRFGLPVRISHVHGASLTMDLKWPLKKMCMPLLPYVCTDKWACGIDAAKFYYGQKAVDKDEILVIRNAIEVDKFLFDINVRNDMRNKYGLQDKFVLGHVGRFATQKNHTFLLDIFAEICKRCDDAFLVLLGEGELKGEIQKKASGLGIFDRIQFAGNVSNANEWYQAFDAYVMPSIWEGLPVTGIEAQAADLPCYFSDTITRETKILDKTKFLPLSDSAEKWAEIILDSYNNERTNRNKEIAATGYDIDVESKKLQNLYEQMYKFSAHCGGNTKEQRSWTRC